MKVSKESYDVYSLLINLMSKLDIDHKMQLQMVTYLELLSVLGTLEAVYNKPTTIEFLIISEDP